MRRLIKGEKGQVFVLSLIVLGIGSLLVGTFLSFMSTNLLATRTLKQLTTAQYTAGAGVEDAIWNIVYGDFTTTVLLDSGDITSYSLAETVNGVNPNITVTRLDPFLASDDFESNTWSGGLGWSGAWDYQGDAQVTQAFGAYEGTYQMVLRQDTGYARRAVNLQGKANVHLQFWAEADSFETGETAECLVSSDGSNWTAVETWQEADADGIYHYYDVDLSSYTMTSQFWIAFQANMSGPDDHLFVDDVQVRTAPPGAILLPSDDFESGDFSGGLGWLSTWLTQGNASVTKSKSPYEGTYHAQLRDAGTYIRRAADLSGQSELRLQFWAKVDFDKSGDEAYCRVSPDSINWTTVRTWTSADNDNTYHFNDIDLSPYSMTSEFWIDFSSGMDKTSDYFFVDSLEITGGTGAGVGPDAVAYEIVSSTPRETITACVLVDDTQVAILAWQYT